ncbi:MAG: hypothetical protein K2H17_11115 [Duncaniella sp.]|uniref:hypothetical protein n=1 Tax=Duncaniella sp. TaxID=2518496 RepID=UPI0023C835B8|nr:hypothetical protein [Duncaniella sp.]MDE5989931.1 hypothetical protein [Duncaniella sp.]
MKKILLSVAAVAMTFVANAAPTVVKTNPNQSNPLLANTVIADNEFFTATTTFDAKGGQTGSAYVFGDVDLAGTGWFQLRSDAAPDATSPFGTQKADCTSIKVEVKKPVTLYCYLRTGNNKQTAVNVFNSSFETMPYANGETGKNCGADGEKNNMWEFSWTLSAGTYCLTELGGTGNVAGLGYEGAEDPGVDPEPAEGQEFKLTGSWPQGEFGTINTPISVDYNTQTITLQNFLGGSADLVVNYALRDASQNPTMPGTMFNLTPVSGVGEAAQGLYPLDGLQTTDVIFTMGGENKIKLEKVGMFFDTYSSIEYKTGGFYELTLYLVANYSDWTSGSWVAASSSKGYFNLVTTIPASADQSGIDSIVTDTVDENAPVEYYNLQGLRINEPAAGQIVIRRQGSKVSKILVR